MRGIVNASKTEKLVEVGPGDELNLPDSNGYQHDDRICTWEDREVCALLGAGKFWPQPFLPACKRRPIGDCEPELRLDTVHHLFAHGNSHDWIAIAPEAYELLQAVEVEREAELAQSVKESLFWPAVEDPVGSRWESLVHGRLLFGERRKVDQGELVLRQ